MGGGKKETCELHTGRRKENGQSRFRNCPLKNTISINDPAGAGIYLSQKINSASEGRLFAPFGD
jgi:hypothetical protein